jgi:hypothetical protein
MLKIAHIISPVKVDQTSDLFAAQPITFETMRRARDFSSNICQVELFSATFSEDRLIVPGFFNKTADLEQSVLDHGVFNKQRKLPILKDILNRLYQVSDAEYFIYTNADIALQPYFYETVVRLIESGYDGFVINRRTIDKKFNSFAQIPLMMAQTGEPHPGHDCFIFKRELYPRLILGDACVGVVFIGKILAWNLALFSDNFHEFCNLHATFHIGNDKIWADTELSDYQNFNHLQAKSVLKELLKQKSNAIELLQGFNILKPRGAFDEFVLKKQ